MSLFYGLCLIFGYLAGSISSAIIVCKLFNLPDPRTIGSNNPGATNVHRIGGKLVGFYTLLGDVLKTALPMLLVYKLNYGRELSLWVGVMAAIGHCFPIYYSFKGGKGVASMLTVVSLVISSFGILAIGTWLLTAYTFSRSSVASIVTSLVIPFYSFHYKIELFLPLCALSTVVLIRHNQNISNLLKGKEPPFSNL